jgi:Pyridoxamine 5'-phosphate oxidase
VYETADELDELQALIDRSFANAGPHLLAIMTPERRLNAPQVVRYLDGIKHISLATVTARGEPRVAPLDSYFVHGRFVASTGGRSIRLGHMRTRSAVSLAHVVGDEVAVVVNGRAEIIERGQTQADELDRIATGIYGSSPFSWGEGVVFIRVQPDVMFAYAFRPENFPELDAPT